MLLQLEGVRKSYGNLPVIRGLDLAVHPGEFVGVIGPNGAGKTTLFGLIAGSLRADGGTVRFKGIDVTASGSQKRCHHGMGRTFQIPQPFVSLSVYENALVAATFGGGLPARAAEWTALDALKRCGLLHLGDTPAGRLTLLQRKRLELARALATGPQLLLLDEVAGGLTDPEVAQLLQLVAQIHEDGVTILWIEHLVHALVSVAQRLVVLTDGAILVDGEPRAVVSSQLVRETYLGPELELQAGIAEVAHA